MQADRLNLGPNDRKGLIWQKYWAVYNSKWLETGRENVINLLQVITHSDRLRVDSLCISSQRSW